MAVAKWKVLGESEPQNRPRFELNPDERTAADAAYPPNQPQKQEYHRKIKYSNVSGSQVYSTS